MMKHSAKFQVNSIKDLAGVARTSFESASAVTLSKMVETKIKKNTCTSSCHKETNCEISYKSDERRKRSCGDKIRRIEGQTEGWME